MPDPHAIFWDDWLLLLIQLAGVAALALFVRKTWEIARETRHAADASNAALQEAREARLAAEAMSQAALHEAREARLAALTPRVMVYFSPEPLHSADIVIENIGSGTATDVVFRFEPELRSSAPDYRPGAFFDTPKFLPPGYRTRHNFDLWSSYLASSLPRRYVVHVTCTGAEDGRTHSVEHVLDVSAIENRVELEQKGIPQLVEDVQRVHREVKDGFERLQRHLERHQRQALYRGEPLPALPAIRQLLVSWRVLAYVHEQALSQVHWDSALEVIREKAYTAAYATVADGLPPATQAAMLQLLAELTRSWGTLYPERFNKLRDAFAALDALYPAHRLPVPAAAPEPQVPGSRRPERAASR